MGWWRRARTTVHGGALQAVPVRSDGTTSERTLLYNNFGEQLGEDEKSRLR